MGSVLPQLTYVTVVSLDFIVDGSDTYRTG